MSESASLPQIFNGQPLRLELSVNGPIHLHQHGQGVTADDIILLTHIESRLKRSATRLKAVDDKTPPK